jgi:hypothetical protein
VQCINLIEAASTFQDMAVIAMPDPGESVEDWEVAIGTCGLARLCLHTSGQLSYDLYTLEGNRIVSDGSLVREDWKTPKLADTSELVSCFRSLFLSCRRGQYMQILHCAYTSTNHLVLCLQRDNRNSMLVFNQWSISVWWLGGVESKPACDVKMMFFSDSQALPMQVSLHQETRDCSVMWIWARGSSPVQPSMPLPDCVTVRSFRTGESVVKSFSLTEALCTSQRNDPLTRFAAPFSWNRLSGFGVFVGQISKEHRLVGLEFFGIRDYPNLQGVHIDPATCRYVLWGHQMDESYQVVLGYHPELLGIER